MTPDSRNRPACNEPVPEKTTTTSDSSITTGADISAYAVELAVHGWAVGPLCHRDPVTRRVLHERGKAPVPHLAPHGVKDFTTDLETVGRWWSGRPWNIGARVPHSMFVLDVDDLDALAELEAEHGTLPDTLTTISGRAAGGKHLYFRRPTGAISQARLPDGIEIKTSTGYTVQPPSIHPDSGQPYRRIDAAVAAPPAWLVSLLRPEVVVPTPPRRLPSLTRTGPSIADRFTASVSWSDVLGPHGWTCLDADPDADGARWRHPTATSACSATVRNGCLFVYSPNTPFTVTEESHPRGYTKFRAHALLTHGGDMSAAAKQLLTEAVS